MEILTPAQFAREKNLRPVLLNELIKFYGLEPEYGRDSSGRFFNRSTLESLLEHINSFKKSRISN
jgi:hypothetical protein